VKDRIILKSDDLIILTERLSEYLSAYKEFEIKNDFYWEVPEDGKYKFEVSPTESEVGSLFDDVSQLLKLKNNDRIFTPVDLNRFAAVLNKLSHVISDINTD